MSYESMAALSDDAAFKARVTSCCQEQALVFKDDGRADMANLAHVILADPLNASGVFELVCVAPNFRDVADSSTIVDPDILAAVQANWPTYAAVLMPPQPAPSP